MGHAPNMSWLVGKQLVWRATPYHFSAHGIERSGEVPIPISSLPPESGGEYFTVYSLRGGCGFNN